VVFLDQSPRNWRETPEEEKAEFRIAQSGWDEEPGDLAMQD